MSQNKEKCVVHIVFHKLRSIAKTSDEDFSFLLARYGMVYAPETLRAEKISEAQEYEGVQIKLTGLLNEAKIPLQIDIGFGDIITPAPENIEYPTLLDAPPPLLRAYTRYTLIAEKFEAMVDLGIANSRMKDFYDIWLLSKLFSFEGSILQKALENTFERRGTTYPTSTPFAFTLDFYRNSQKLLQWEAFVKRAKLKNPVGSLTSVVMEISDFITPVIQSHGAFENVWQFEIGKWTKQGSHLKNIDPNCAGKSEKPVREIDALTYTIRL